MKLLHNEKQQEIVKGILQGGTKGAAVGAAASLATGTAVIVTAPAWIPFFGGTMVVSAASVAAWAAGGAVIGAVGNATRKYLVITKREDTFKKEFGID